MHVFNVERVLSNLDNDKELLQSLIELFASQTSELVKKIEESIIEGDKKALAIAAHTLKGVLGNFCADYAVASAFKLEEIGRHGEIDSALSELRTLKYEIDRLQTALKEYSESQI